MGTTCCGGSPQEKRPTVVKPLMKELEPEALKATIIEQTKAPEISTDADSDGQDLIIKKEVEEEVEVEVEVETEKHAEVEHHPIDKFQKAYDSDPELRKALEAYDLESLADEAKEQIIAAYEEVGAAGLQIEVDQSEDSGCGDFADEAETSIDATFRALCETDHDLLALVDGTNLSQ